MGRSELKWDDFLKNILHNFLLKAVALGLAVLTWLYVNEQLVKR